MILTFKIKHCHDFSDELRKAKKVAEFAIRNRSQSSKDVKHIGLKAAIANQVLRKYSRNPYVKRVNTAMLTIPKQQIRLNKEQRVIYLPCLKLKLPYHFKNDFEKINQVEISDEFAFVSVTVPEAQPVVVQGAIGVDRNTTGHCVVVANPATGKVWKIGKEAEHIHKKYSRLRRYFQKKGKLGKLKAVGRREHNIIKDLNHKISRKVVEVAKENRCMIRMEKLKGIRETTKQAKSFRYSLHSWAFYQQQMFIDYKAGLSGIPISYDEPAWTSQFCSKCGLMGVRNGKGFECPHCGHVDGADPNAAFNIALGPERMHRLGADRDALNGSTDAPREAPV